MLVAGLSALGLLLNRLQRRTAESRRLAEEMEEARNRFADYAESAADWFWEMDADLKLTFLSAGYETRSRLSPESILGKTRQEIFADQIETSEPWARHFADLEARRPFSNFEIVYRVSNREARVASLSGKPVFDQNHEFLGYRGSGLDLTHVKETEEERTRLEKQLRQVQKMEAVGQLTGGIAHDFNNLLAVVQGNAQLMLDRTREDSTYLSEILASCSRGAELTNRLLSFARQQPLAPQSIDIGKQVNGMMNLIERALGETIDIEILVADNLTTVLVDPGQVENAILNLSLNARDAMPGGGKLTIACTNARFDTEFIAANAGAIEGEYVQLAVSDTGTGMSEVVLSRALDPFFTSKGVGHGSGLGLSMVYGFAQQSRGYLSLESEEHKGTTVKLFLPRGDAVPTDRGEAGSIRSRPSGNGETILVIEDDRSLRGLIKEMLESLDYRFIGVETAIQGRVIIKGRDTVDLLLTDVVLPGGLSGPQLVEEVRAQYPDLPVIFMSGYQGDVNAAPKLRPLLRKPFDIETLSVALHEHLSSA